MEDVRYGYISVYREVEKFVEVFSLFFCFLIIFRNKYFISFV